MGMTLTIKEKQSGRREAMKTRADHELIAMGFDAYVTMIETFDDEIVKIERVLKDYLMTPPITNRSGSCAVSQGSA